LWYVVLPSYTDSNLYCIVEPDIFPPCRVSQPQCSFRYAFFSFLAGQKTIAALDAIKFYIRQYVMPPGFVETRIHL
jgi:hypothetical protein